MVLVDMKGTVLLKKKNGSLPNSNDLLLSFLPGSHHAHIQ